MKEYDVSLIKPIFITKNDERFCSENRLWQSAPSAAMTKKGRIFCVYSGDNIGGDELPTNYTACCYSDDNGESFKLAFYAYHEHEVRMSETLLFFDNDENKLYHFWTQSYRYFDGRGGIWCAVCSNPDEEFPIFSEPKRICDGFMAHNPTILKNGKWIFPASVWEFEKSPYNLCPEYEKVSIWSSENKISNLEFVGGVHSPAPDYTENTVFEAKDGHLIMLFRTSEESGGIFKTESFDDGKNWTKPEKFVLSGPSSRFMVSRFPSGALLLVNHYNFQGRNNLTALISYDDGETFPHSLLLDERCVSYPSGNITEDGRAIIAYDRERCDAREILISSFTEEDIVNGTFGKNSFTKKLVAKGGEKDYI